MQEIVSADPFRCRVWNLHHRLEDYINEESCRTEIESFAAYGQLVPALGRRLQHDVDYDIELVCGARRLFVARHLRKPLVVELRELSDREAAITIDIENSQRRDISPYERGIGYARWLRAGYFESQDDLSRALKVSASQVSRLLRVARLPSVIINAFDRATDICETWGLELADALEDSQRRGYAIKAARQIAATSSRPSAPEV